MIHPAAALLALVACSASAEPPGLDQALDELARGGKFSGAVVIRGAEGVRFARGYGRADPFAGREFTPDTPVDSGSLAKPVTAAAVLALASEGRIDLDAPATRYLPELGHRNITVRQLLSHSAGLRLDESAEGLIGKSNLHLIAAARAKPLLFTPGTAFTYCNLCTIALAEIAERVSRRPYLELVRRLAHLPGGAGLRPARLADWKGRAVGFRRSATGTLQRADSYEGEAFYGSANLSISAAQLAEWGSRWWQPGLSALRQAATQPAAIGRNRSGLTLGNWYCAPAGRRCHYLGHHEGFHHMLYWDSQRRISVAMVSNNSLAPELQQRLQRAIVELAEGRTEAGRRELQEPLPNAPVILGTYRLPDGPVVVAGTSERLSITRGGLTYPAYPIGRGIRYVPGLDTYVAGGPRGTLRWLNLYQDFVGEPETAPEQAM